MTCFVQEWVCDFIREREKEKGEKGKRLIGEKGRYGESVSRCDVMRAVVTS